MTRMSHCAITTLVALIGIALQSTAFGQGLFGGRVSFEFHEEEEKTVYDRMSGGVTIEALPVLDVSTSSWLVGKGAGSWRDPLSWDAGYNIINGALWTKKVIDIYGDLKTFDIRAYAEFEELTHLLYNSGPTERSVGHTLAFPLTGADDPHVDAAIKAARLEVSATAGVAIRFHPIIGTNTTISMDQSHVTLEELSLDTGSHLIGNATMVVHTDVTNMGKFSDLAGTIGGNLRNHAGLAEGGGVYITGALNLGAQLNNTGDIFIQSGSLNMASATSNAGRLVVLDGTLACAGGLTNLGTGTIWLNGGNLTGNGGLLNAGTFEWSEGFLDTTVSNLSPHFRIVGDSAKIMTQTAHLRNTGTVTDSSTGLNFWSGSQISNLSGGLYDLQADGQYFGHMSDGGQINNEGTFRKSAGEGESMIGPRVAFQNSGAVEALSGTLAFSGTFTQTAGSTRLNGGNIRSTSPLSILGGTIEGTGDILASVLNEGGTVTPGFSPGVLTVYGDYTQGPDATLLLEIAGLGLGEYDIFNVTGRATLGGYLEIDFLNDFRPTLGDSFDFFTYGSCIGQFDSIYVRGFPDYSFIPTYGLTGLSLETGSVPAAVPLPSSLCLAAIGIVTSLRWMRRRAGVVH